MRCLDIHKTMLHSKGLGFRPHSFAEDLSNSYYIHIRKTGSLAAILFNGTIFIKTVLRRIWINSLMIQLQNTFSQLGLYIC